MYPALRVLRKIGCRRNRFFTLAFFWHVIYLKMKIWKSQSASYAKLIQRNRCFMEKKMNSSAKSGPDNHISSLTNLLEFYWSFLILWNCILELFYKRKLPHFQTKGGVQLKYTWCPLMMIRDNPSELVFNCAGK